MRQRVVFYWSGSTNLLVINLTGQLVFLGKTLDKSANRNEYHTASLVRGSYTVKVMLEGKSIDSANRYLGGQTNSHSTDYVQRLFIWI